MGISNEYFVWNDTSVDKHDDRVWSEPIRSGAAIKTRNVNWISNLDNFDDKLYETCEQPTKTRPKTPIERLNLTLN